MQGRTHRIGGTLCALAGYTILEKKGLLIKDINPLLQLTVMYPFAIYGSVFSDFDHNWNSCPCKDPISFCVNRLIHIGTTLRQTGHGGGLTTVLDAKHRSWQTHSDLFLFLNLVLFWYIGGVLTGSSYVIFEMVGMGFLLGVISHLILDMLTPEGVWLCLFVAIRKLTGIRLPRKVHLVPKSGIFATGGTWESVVCKVMWILCFLLLTHIGYMALPYKLVLGI